MLAFDDTSVRLKKTFGSNVESPVARSTSE
jgi:hypothetical protein